MGQRSKRKTGPMILDGKVDLNDFYMVVFLEVNYHDGVGIIVTLYTAAISEKGLKSIVRIVNVDCMEPDKKAPTWKVSIAGIESSTKDIIDISRFQIGFLQRACMQFTVLIHCLVRQEEALAFHFNMSQTAINVARAFAHLDK